MKCLISRFIAGVLAFALGLMPAALAQPVDAESVKLAYIWNFPKFVDWPDGSPPSGGSFTICIIGDELVGVAKNYLEGRKRGSVNVEVVNGKRVSLNVCQLVFVSSTESQRIPTVLAQVSGQPVLTVSDAENFAKDGGVIGLVSQDQRLTFEINVGAAQAANIKIRATLADLAVKRY